MAVSQSLSVTQVSQSVANNTSTIKIKWTSTQSGQSYNAYPRTAYYYVSVNGGTETKYSVSYTLPKSSTTTIVDTNLVVSHDSEGKCSVTVRTWMDTSISAGIVQKSQSLTLTTIPRKSSLSVGNGTLGTAQTLTVTRQATSYTHTIVAKCGSASSTICTKSTTASFSFTPPIAWASQNTTGTSVSVTYTITTYSGNTSVGSNSYTKTCSIPASVKPSCSLTVTDDMGYADKYDGYLKGLSIFKVVVSATTSYSSAIASYKTTANGATYTASSFTTGVLASYGTLTVSATVTDKRSRTGTASKSLTVLNYAAPKVSALSVHRCDEDGTNNDQGEYVKVVFSGTVTSLNSKNSAKYVLKYKKSSATSYTSVTLTDYAGSYSVSNATYIFAAETGSSYDVQIAITDDLKTTTQSTSASTAFTLMHFSAGGTGIGIGKIAESENMLDIGVPVKFGAGIVNNVLWSGGSYMTASQTATLSEPVSKQPNGIVLVFSRYSSGKAQDWHFNHFFVHKNFVAMFPGYGSSFLMTTEGNFAVMASKYLYIHDDSIVGNDVNTATGTGTSGVKYENNGFVLRYVIGV